MSQKGFIQIDNELINKRFILTLKKIDECIKISTENYGGPFHNKTERTVCKQDNPRDYYGLVGMFKQSDRISTDLPDNMG